MCVFKTFLMKSYVIFDVLCDFWGKFNVFELCFCFPNAFFHYFEVFSCFRSIFSCLCVFFEKGIFLKIFLMKKYLNGYSFFSVE